MSLPRSSSTRRSSKGSAKPLPMHPALKNALLEWRVQSLYPLPADFVFASLRKEGRKPLDLAAVLNRKIKPAFAKFGIRGVGWHTFRHTGRKHAGRNGRTPTHHPRLPASQQSECDQQVPAGHIRNQATGAGQTGRIDPAHGIAVARKNHTHPTIVPNHPAHSMPSVAAIESDAALRVVDAIGSGALVGPRLGPRFLVGFRKLLKDMVGPNGLEPSTSSVSGKRSNQLSYGPTIIVETCNHRHRVARGYANADMKFYHAAARLMRCPDTNPECWLQFAGARWR